MWLACCGCDQKVLAGPGLSYKSCALDQELGPCLSDTQVRGAVKRVDVARMDVNGEFQGHRSSWP